MPVRRTPMSTDRGAPLYRLLAWASPSFPTGAFSYSHGLEAAHAAGAVEGRAGLAAWIAAIVAQGSGRIDADLLCDAYHAARETDIAGLDAVNRRGLAFRTSAELALESEQQGAAFVATCCAAWPEEFVERWAAGLRRASRPPAGDGAAKVCHAVAFGAVAARAEIALEDALVGYLEAFAGNLVSAGLRLGIIGQTDGQRILAALEPIVAQAAEAAVRRDTADFGAATFAVDLASMAHEMQYSRLFRS